MRRTSGMSLAFPPFSGAVRWLVLANAGVFLAIAILGATAPGAGRIIENWFALVPALAIRGWLWQLITYSFLHAGLFHLLFNMLSLWMFGGMIESSWGTRRFLEFYCLCVVFAALSTIAFQHSGIRSLEFT